MDVYIAQIQGAEEGEARIDCTKARLDNEITFVKLVLGLPTQIQILFSEPTNLSVEYS